jgi:hypothetical protein
MEQNVDVNDGAASDAGAPDLSTATGREAADREASSVAALAGRFHRLFLGSDRAHGIYTVTQQVEPGQKADGHGKTLAGPASLALWQRHLGGTTRLGVIPLIPADRCGWGAIDIDVYDGLDHVTLAERIARLGLPLTVVRSKSGGAHLYLFLREPADPGAVVDALRRCAQRLGCPPSTEVFPKQLKLPDDGKGNWLNMPYFQGDYSTQYAFDPETGKALLPGDFLDRAEKMRVAEGELPAIGRGAPEPAPDELLAGGPPCLVALARNGLTEGARNDGLFNFGVFLKKKYPDDWRERLAALNQAKLAPPLPSSEVRGIAKSVGRKDYGYKCNAEPIRSVCDRPACLTCKFGIGGMIDARDDRRQDEEGHRPGREAAREAQVLKQLIDSTDVYHDSAKTGFADVEINGRRATYAIKSGMFNRYVRAHAYHETRRAPSADVIKRAVDTIEARATIDGPEREVCRRIGRTPDAIYLDLGDETWRAVEVNAAGWRIVERPPVRFRRHEGMLPLPEPVRGGKVEELKTLLNVEDDAFILAVGWLMGALRGEGPYPPLVVSGEQGSAKSTFCRLLVGLIDPNAVPLRALPRSDHDLYIAARNAHALCFDNVSTLAPWLSDTLCRLATGGGFATRELYTDTSEVTFRGMNPIVLNGIEDFVERPDLADRAITLMLRSIPDVQRRPEREINAEYEQLRPRALGALLDGVSAALRHLHETKLDELPRMADFALWVAAGERALWQPGRFMSAYAENRDQTQVDLMEADTVASEVVKLMSGFPPDKPWEGTMEELLERLNIDADFAVTRDHRWPKTPRAMGGRLRRAQPSLRRLGVDVLDPVRSNGRRVIRLRRALLPGEQGRMLTPEEKAGYAQDASLYKHCDPQF